MNNLPKLNDAFWASIIVDSESDLDRITHVLDDCGIRVERLSDGLFIDSDNGCITLQFRVEEPKQTRWDMLNA